MIAKTGRIEFGVPGDAYHAEAGLGSSTLKRLHKYGPEAVHFNEPYESRSLTVGSAVHAVLDNSFGHLFQAADDSYKTATSQKFAALSASVKLDNGKDLLTADEYATALACGNALKAGIGEARLSKAAIESSIFWRAETALSIVDCKCRPDILIEGELNEYIEIKTAADVSRDGIRSAIRRYGYWLQQAHYEDGIRKTCGPVRTTFAFVQTRPSNPAVVFVRLSDETVSNSIEIWQALLNEYAERRSSGNWISSTIDEPLEVHVGLQTPQVEIDWEGIE